MKSLGRKPEGARLERIKASPRWAGEQFRNVHSVIPGLRDPNASMPTLSDFLCGGERRVPRGPWPSMNPLESWMKSAASGLRVTWLGHSTLLIEIDGLRVLTDPVWGLRASPSQLVGPKRFQPVPVPLRAMPPADLVLVSHDHYDHLDYPTIRELAKRDVPFVTSLGVGAHLTAWGVQPGRIVELDWWESHRLPNTELTVTAAPSQHFSGRGLHDRNATLWSSLVIRLRRHSMFFSGDTALTTEYQTIRERLGPFDLVMLEVGAFHPAWGDIHLGPENALKARAARRRPFPANTLGDVRPCDACLGPACGNLAEVGSENGSAARHAAPGRTGRALARGGRQAVVARRRHCGAGARA